jgi:predicted DNA-binding ribbon-helix-helix protein
MSQCYCSQLFQAPGLTALTGVGGAEKGRAITMCNLFVGADPELWESKSKSLRIDGFVTSIRMENVFWRALAEIAYRDEMSTNELITTLYHESLDAGHDVGNFTSFLRVCALRYYSLMAVGDVSISLEEPIYRDSATDILQREVARMRERELMRSAKAS